MNENIVGMLVGLVIGLVLAAIIVVVFRWLWNSTMPDVFGLREITFGQAFKILLLAGILFGSHRVVEVPQQVSNETATTTAGTE
jgi:hypothetical protein